MLRCTSKQYSETPAEDAYNRIVFLLPYITPFIPAERRVHLHIPRAIYINPQWAKKMCLTLHIEQIRPLGHITEDKLVVALDKRAFRCAGGGQGQ